MKCTCGKNSTKGESCVYSLYHYSTKCSCFKAGRSCNSNCRCKGCKNPYGGRPDIKTPKTGQKRKRDQYSTQVYPLKGRKTSAVMDRVSQEVSTGSMSNLEYLLISAIVQSHITVPWSLIHMFSGIVLLSHTQSHAYCCILLILSNCSSL